MTDDKEIEQARFGHIDKYQIVLMSALLGKRLNPLKGIVLDYNSGLMIHHYDDNTFSIWGCEKRGNLGHQALEKKRPDPWDLYGLGLISKEDWDAYNRDIKSRNEDTEKMRRRNQYEILKAEFEGE